MANIKKQEYEILCAAVKQLKELSHQYDISSLVLATYAESVLEDIDERRLKDNKRTLTAINQKRKVNKNYAR